MSLRKNLEFWLIPDKAKKQFKEYLRGIDKSPDDPLSFNELQTYNLARNLDTLKIITYTSIASITVGIALAKYV